MQIVQTTRDRANQAAARGTAALRNGEIGKALAEICQTRKALIEGANTFRDLAAGLAAFAEEYEAKAKEFAGMKNKLESALAQIGSKTR